jgi:hypothetical protein
MGKQTIPVPDSIISDGKKSEYHPKPGMGKWCNEQRKLITKYIQ